MASNQPNAGNPSDRRSRFDELAANPQKVLIGLLVLLFALLLIPIVLLIKSKWAVSPQLVIVIAALLKIEIIIAAVVYFAVGAQSTLIGADRLRVLVLTLTALIGANAALLGLGLPFTDRLKPIFSAGIEGWRANKSALALCGGLLVGGLMLMFLGVQLARSFERTRTDMRRVLYGFNAFLSCALLLAALGLFNVMAYSGVGPFKWFDKTIDWTSSKIYTLRDTSRSLLENLKQPVKVYIMLPNEGSHRDVTTLLDNCRSVTDQISWQNVSRDRDSGTLSKLQKDYQFRAAAGLLVVYGSGDNEVWEFIKEADLANQSGQSKGEAALVKTIDYLASGKAKAKIYFTQGQGELNVQQRGAMGADDTMSALWERLGRGNYELKELKFSADVTRVPPDADVVVIARPTKQFSAQALTALDDYMKDGKKKGKLFILFDVYTPGNKWAVTGLEKFVEKFNVKVNEDRVLDADARNPAILGAVTNLRSPTPIGPAYWSQRGPFVFRLVDARSVDPLGAGAEAGGRFTTEPLMFAGQPGSIWVEKDLAVDADKLAAQIRQDPALRDKLTPEKLVSVAVTVSESKSAPMRGNPHENFGGDQQPRMIVLGDSTWISDPEITGQMGSANFSLFGACLSWLRERPDITPGADESAERPVYQLNVKGLSLWQLFFQPLTLMVLGVLGLGGAVWVARRR
jgi:hypothetical protein